MAAPELPPLPGVAGPVLVGNALLFGRILRHAGLAIDPGQTRCFLRVLGLIGLAERTDVKAAGRAIFTKSRDDRRIYDDAFDLFWRRSTTVGGPSKQLPRIRQHERPQPDVTLGPDAAGEVVRAEVAEAHAPVGASSVEALRTADFAHLTSAEARDAAAMVDTLTLSLPRRPARRPRIGRTGPRLAGRAMLRRALGSGGEAVEWRWLRRRTRPRPVALVCDVSGSMERYTRFMLRFAHALARSGAPVEVFVFSTRLTRITRELRIRHPDRALRRVAEKVVDWSSGTRIGACIKELNRRWVRRTIRSGAVVLVVSDGWERDDPARLAREMATLRRSCHRLIWLDPLASRPGFEPATVGLRATLPHVDAFLPCGTVASLEELGRRLVGLATHDSPATGWQVAAGR